MKYLFILASIFVAGCASIFEGTHSDLDLDIPFNTRVFDEDTTELKIEHGYKDSHIELESSKSHDLIFINDSLVKKLTVEPSLSIAWVILDVLVAPGCFGYPIVHDFILGSWNIFEDMKLEKDDFSKADFDIENFLKASNKPKIKKVLEPQKNVLYLERMTLQQYNGLGINYERNLYRDLLLKNSMLNARAGFQGIVEPFIISGFPVQLIYLLGKKHHVELGLGVLFDFYPPNKENDFLPNSTKGLFTIGYRYQEPDGGNVFRIGYAPFWKVDDLMDDDFLYGEHLVFYISFGCNW